MVDGIMCKTWFVIDHATLQSRYLLSAISYSYFLTTLQCAYRIGIKLLQQLKEATDGCHFT